MRSIRPIRLIRPLAATVAAVLAALVVEVPAPAPAARAAQAQGRPNILIIVTDNQRLAADTVTARVMPKTRTWFRDRGARFPNAYVSTPLCCPSRATIMTGRYSHNHGVWANHREAVSNLDHRTTMQRYLRDQGYRTGVFGKFFNGWDVAQDPPNFDRWAIMKRGYYDARFNVGTAESGGSVRTVRRYSTRFIGNQTRRFIEDAHAEDPDRPWFALVAPYAPHRLAVPEPKYADAPVGRWDGNPAVFEKNRSDKPPYVKKRTAPPLAQLKAKRAKELRTLLSVDDLVKALMKELGRTGERKDTVAVFLSDNGLMWGEHGLVTKSVPYRHSVSIPMFLRWPAGGVAGGVADLRPAANLDLAPTLLTAAGVDVAALDPPMDGRSLLAGPPRERALMEHRQNNIDSFVPTWASLRTPRVQYVEYYAGDRTTVTFREYYDLDGDPWQLKNLLGDGNRSNDPPADVLAELSARLAADRGCAGTSGPAACP